MCNDLPMHLVKPDGSNILSKMGSKERSKPSRQFCQLIKNYSELPNLLCHGLFVAAKRSPSFDRSIISTFQSYRLLAKEFRTCIDEYLCTQMKKVNQLTLECWTFKRDYEILRVETAEVCRTTKSKLKERLDLSIKQLLELMKVYFPQRVVDEYMDRILIRSSHDLKTMKSPAPLIPTVTMLFSMSTEVCYINVPRLKKRCTGENRFNTIEWFDDSHKVSRACVFSSERSITKATTAVCNFRAPGKSMQTMLAMELFAFRGVLHVDDMIRLERRTIHKRRDGAFSCVLSHVKFLLTHPDVAVPSLQRSLDINDVDVCNCLTRVRQKQLNVKQRYKEISEIHVRYQIGDIDEIFNTNRKYRVKTLNQLRDVFPGIGETAFNAIVANPTKNHFNNGIVAKCLKELMFLMNDVKEVEDENLKCVTSVACSREAYDFISGTTNGVLCNYGHDYFSRLLDDGASALHKANIAGTDVNVSTILAAMKLFDTIDETWTLSVNKTGSLALTSGKIRLGICFINCYAFTGNFKRTYLNHIGEYVNEKHNMILPAYPEHKNVVTFVKYLRRIISQLSSNPQTKCFALTILQIRPTDLVDSVIRRSEI